MGYLYACHRTHKTALYLCRIEGGLTEEVFAVFREEFFPYISDSPIQIGETIRTSLTGNYLVLAPMEKEGPSG